MIYSKFGTTLTLVSRADGTNGRVSVQATVDDTAEIHEYYVADLKADDGLAEIDAAVAALPAKTLGSQNGRRRQPR